MAREVMEETGLDLDAAVPEARHHLISTPGGVVIFRRYRFSQSADEIAAQVQAHIAADPEPEISEAVLIRDASMQPVGIMSYMPALVGMHFASA
jgi:8-oxo-dGTP pyrophosphatase MutT (NUDIX family)